MHTLISLPPHPAETVAELPEAPEAHHLVAVDTATGRRHYAIRGQWRELEPVADPHRVRPEGLPLLADGFDFTGWIRAYGKDSIRPIDGAGTRITDQLGRAAALVRQDGASLGYEGAIAAQTDLSLLCEQVHYSLDLHADETDDLVVYDAPTERFYLLTR